MEYDSGPVVPSSKSPALGRPGCITIYAVVLALSGALYVILALLLGGSVLADGPDFVLMALVYTLCLTAFAAIPLVTAVGLWRMRRWAWWLAVLLHSLGIVFALITLCAIVTLAESSEIVTSFGGTLLVVLSSGLILRWFLRNRQRFGPKTVVGPDGQVVVEPSSNREKIIATLAGVVLILFLVGCAVVVLFTLLGPQIGNAFSQITSGLETTPAGR